MSLFGWREKRRIEILEDREARHLVKIAQQVAEIGNLKAVAEGRQAVMRIQAEEVRLYRQEIKELAGRGDRYQLAWTSARQRATQTQAEGDASRRALLSSTRSYLHLMDTGEPMPLFVGPSRAQMLTDRLGRALRACARYRAELAAQYRVSDFLGRQLLDSVSGDDPSLRALAAAVKDRGVSS